MSRRGTLALVAMLAAFSACDLGNIICTGGSHCSTISGPSALATPTQAPTPSVSPTVRPGEPTPTPDPCKPVVGVNVSGPSSVKIGSTIAFDVTPVGPFGPLEGPVLDLCNAARHVEAVGVSANLRQIGSTGAFNQQFVAIGLGPFSVSFRVEGAVSAAQTGTVIQ